MNKLFRLPAVQEFSGMKRTQIAEHIKRGEFPAPIKLTESGRAVAWMEEELLAWRNQRAAQRETAAA